jgi:uncharacterized protein YdeI (YjbR/CyaY-like superfamily)
MSVKDPRIDAYIETAQPFAQPILKHIRSVVHAAVPDVQETMKWSHPHFDYQGAMLCSMAAFKAHAVMGFWKAKLLAERGFKELEGGAEPAMGHFGRLTSITDLPNETRLTKMIKAAAALNDEGITIKREKSAPKPAVTPPAYFMAAVKKNRKAFAAFAAFSPSHRREYVEWVTEAKTDATRDKRLAQTVTWLAEGKSRNWKYERA